MNLNTNLIHSNRLDLVLLDARAIEYSLGEDTDSLQSFLGADIPPDWFAANALIELRYQQIIRTSEYQPWSLRAMILREKGMMIGHIGFHTQPGASYLQPYAPNGVEFGFTVFPDFRRNGFAREASTALMGWAYQQQAVSEFVLTISPDNVPSLRLAQRLGFKRIGSHVDEVDGVEDIYRLDYQPRNK
jgi:RimJ/RimL family protein N-acetyltransferase